VNLRGTRDTIGAFPQGRLAENIMHFVRLLRQAGLPVGPDRTLDAVAAVKAVGVAHRTDFREALAAVLVSRQEHLALFDQAFDLFWRNPKLRQGAVASLPPRSEDHVPGDAPPEVPARLAQALTARRPVPPQTDGEEVKRDAAVASSPREVLHDKDFATMTVDEVRQVKALLARLKLPVPERPVRRSRPAPRRSSVDLRATLRAMTGAAGAIAPLRFRARTRRAPPLVVLCDISGSMDRYARMLLHFVHAITNDGHRVHTFVFGTRLTNITRFLRHRDVDVALRNVTAQVQDWAGGTRIGACMADFNRHWSRRVLGQNAVVLLISDGLDAEGGAGLAVEVARLARSCGSLVWLNPLLRYPGFEARPAGIRAMLPHVDDFRPVHSLASLTELAAALAPSRSRVRRSGPATDRRVPRLR
jgi:uncharacterized protein with von Willebrand factor type A (vWA) domain